MDPTSKNPADSPPQEDAHHLAMERVYAGRVPSRAGYTEIPTAVFLATVDLNMPELPEVAFYDLSADDSVEEVRAKGEPFSPLALSLRKTLWVKNEEMPLVRAFVETRILGGAPANGSAFPGAPAELPMEKRMETLRRSAILVVEDLFSNPSPENIAKSVKMVGSFVYVIMKDPKAYSFLSKLSSHDPYTLQHSVGTAVHCIILGRKAGISSEGDLTELGMAGLLHDIGKTKVKREIINKNGPLDENEWEEMKSHPGEGYEIVKDDPSLSERTKRAILEHHEDKTGTGYPHGRKISDIDIFSRIVCLCDIFNALTTDRSYSKARSPFDAFQLMREKLFNKIDEGLFRQLVLIYGGKID